MTAATLPPRAPAWRLVLARSVAWALLLGGWIGVAALADRLTAGPFAAGAVVAAWLLATALASEALGRVRWPATVWRLALPVAALLVAWAMRAALHGGGTGALLGLALAWGGLLALASATVRALRLASPARPAASPVTAATAGALLAWAAVGDPSDLPALADRLAGLAGLAAMALAVLRPGADRPGPASARPGCRAGLFDCSMPAWPAGAWRDPARSPLQLAALVMLPMMWGLPQMLALCRSAAWPAQAVLGLHLAAMFLPACVLGLWRDPPRPPRLAGPCAVLLVLGAGAAFAGGPWAGWGLALAHGMAWSLAWAARLAPGAGRSQAPAPWRAGALSAGLVLLLGALQALGGASTLTLVHGLLGLMAAAIWLAAVAWRPAPALLARPTGPG